MLILNNDDDDSDIRWRAFPDSSSGRVSSPEKMRKAYLKKADQLKEVEGACYNSLLNW